MANMKVIDMVVKGAEREDLPDLLSRSSQLRDDHHPSWDAGNWTRNGFISWQP
jgi:hypothetical protein